MSKKFTFIIIAGVVVGIAGWGYAQPVDIYVAITGNNDGPGTSDVPFATPHRAQQAVKELIQKGGDRDIRVHITAGVYPLDQPLVFGPEDSPADDHAVTYAAVGGKVIFSGGRIITGWEQIDSEKNLWRAVLPEVQAEKRWFRQLFSGDKRLTRARFPDAGQWLEVKTVDQNYRRFELGQMVHVNDPAGQGTELVMCQIWSSSRALLDTCTEAEIITATPVGWIGHSATSAEEGRKCFLEHAREYLDQPGEWYLDRSEAAVYYLARPDEHPNMMDITAPRLDQLIVLKGDKDRPVRNIHFSGIDCAYAAWQLPPFGYSGIQACHYGTAYKKEITRSLMPAVVFEYSHHCSFNGGRIAHCGAGGIALARGCRDNQIIGNEITDVGGNAVVIGWHEKEDGCQGLWQESGKIGWTDPSDGPCRNTVSDNFIHHCAVVQFGGVGIASLFNQDTVISHNLICYLPYTGISVGFIWGDEPTSQRGNIISHNYIHHVMQMLHDGGGIYTLGYQPGTRVDNNLIHDVANGHGLYTDEGSSHILFQNNIVYRLSDFAYQHHYGHDNIIRNNIFASAGRNYIHRGRADRDVKKGISFTIDRNIFWINNDHDVFVHSNKDEGADYFMMDNNVFWPGMGKEVSFEGQSLDQWRRRGHDIDSIIADPLFEDADADDFRLKPQSPAFQFYFQPIDMSDAGPQEPYKSKFKPLILDCLLSPMVVK